MERRGKVQPTAKDLPDCMAGLSPREPLRNIAVRASRKACEYGCGLLQRRKHDYAGMWRRFLHTCYGLFPARVRKLKVKNNQSRRLTAGQMQAVFECSGLPKLIDPGIFPQKALEALPK